MLFDPIALPVESFDPVEIDAPPSRADLIEAQRAAIRLFRMRRRRDALLGAEQFGEPAWDMLLDLFTSECRGQQITVSSSCAASAVPVTTALRHLASLERDGLILSHPDPHDRRRRYLTLNEETRRLMIALLAHGM